MDLAVKPGTGRWPEQVEEGLIVHADDDPAIRDLVALSLTLAGYRVVSCVDGLEAVDAAQNLHPRALITDVLVARLDGVRAARLVRSFLGDGMPIVLFTGRDRRAPSLRPALRLPNVHYLCKSAGMTQLLSTLIGAGLQTAPRPRPRAAADGEGARELTG